MQETILEIKQEIRPKNWGKIIGTILVAGVIFGAIVFGPRLFKTSPSQVTTYQDPEASGFTAVFLANGQVYFGEMVSNSASEIVIKNVYYLQVDNPADTKNGLNQSHFNLIKLGQELHGPTDTLFVNRSQVLFYENLRKDSKIVESIGAQATKKN